MGARLRPIAQDREPLVEGAAERTGGGHPERRSRHPLRRRRELLQESERAQQHDALRDRRLARDLEPAIAHGQRRQHLGLDRSEVVLGEKAAGFLYGPGDIARDGPFVESARPLLRDRCECAGERGLGELFRFLDRDTVRGEYRLPAGQSRVILDVLAGCLSDTPTQGKSVFGKPDRGREQLREWLRGPTLVERLPACHQPRPLYGESAGFRHEVVPQRLVGLDARAQGRGARGVDRQHGLAADFHQRQEIAPDAVGVWEHYRKHRRACDGGVDHIATGLEARDRRLRRLARARRRGNPRAMRLFESAVPLARHLPPRLLDERAT